MPSLEERCYETAANEVAEKNFTPGVWGKAFSEALGDPQKTIALYIRFRAQQLMQEDRHRRVKTVLTTAEAEIGRVLKAIVIVLGASLVCAICGVALMVLLRSIVN